MDEMKRVFFNSMMLPGQTIFPDTINIDLQATAPVASVPIKNLQPKSAKHVDTPPSDAESPKYKDVNMQDFPQIVGFV